MAQVVVTPPARRNIDEAIPALSLPDDARTRIARSLRPWRHFRLPGPELGGHWAPTRFVVGPWSWMILPYRYEQSADRGLCRRYA